MVTGFFQGPFLYRFTRKNFYDLQTILGVSYLLEKHSMKYFIITALLAFSLTCSAQYNEGLKFYQNGALEMAYKKLENVQETDKNYKQAQRLMNTISEELTRQTVAKMKKDAADQQKEIENTPAFIKYPEPIGDIFVDSVNISEIKDLQYIQVVGYQKNMFTNKVIVTVDYGQFKPFWTTKPTTVETSDGKIVIFQGMVDALNFFIKNGWEFINETKYTLGNSNVSHFLFKKKA